MIDYLCGSAATVAGGFESLVLHYRLAATDNRVEVESIPGGCKVAVHPLVPMEPHVDEFTLAVLAGRFRRLTGGAFVPSRVLFRGDVGDIAARAALLGCPVLCGQPVSALEIDAARWKAPITRADPLLHQLLATLAARELSRTAHAMLLESALRARLRDALADSDADVARMARLMGLSVRTLQRRLAQAGRRRGAVTPRWWTISGARNPCDSWPTPRWRWRAWPACWAMPSRPPSRGLSRAGMAPRPASGAGRRMHHRPWADWGLERLSGPHFGAPPDLSRAASPSSPAF